MNEITSFGFVMPWWAEPQRHTVVVMFVSVCVCVLLCLGGWSPKAYGSRRVCLCVCVCGILQCAFLCDRDELSNESCNATTVRHSTTAKLARFLI